VAQLGMGDKIAWINNQQDWPDIYGLPPTTFSACSDDLVLQARSAGS